MHSHKLEQVNDETSIKPTNTLKNTEVPHAALYNNVTQSSKNWNHFWFFGTVCDKIENIQTHS